jgi:hypothetical protein
MPDILLIPGIGGHPLFHLPLINSLSQYHRIHTAPHGDFFTEPYVGIAPHVAHWRAQARTIEADSIVILALSFGVHVVPGLLSDNDVAVSKTILISPWLPDKLGRFGLRLAATLPKRYAARLLAKKLMRWSEKSGDPDEIAMLRAELYDDPEYVANRWFQRMLAIRQGLDWHVLERLAEDHSVNLIFGADELLNQFQCRRLDTLAIRHKDIKVNRISGGHEIGHIWTPDLHAALDAALQNNK